MTTTEEKLETIHAVTADFDTIFTWDYERSRESLVKLYEKAKTSQWNATEELDWSIDVDPEKVGRELGAGGTVRFQTLAEATIARCAKDCDNISRWSFSIAASPLAISAGTASSH